LPEGEKWAEIKGYPWEKKKLSKQGVRDICRKGGIEVGRRLEISAGKEG
jgi:hypothetical protein